MSADFFARQFRDYGLTVLDGTDPLDKLGDLDEDGLTDADEILVHHTDHDDADSDRDGLDDGCGGGLQGAAQLPAPAVGCCMFEQQVALGLLLGI